MDLKRIKKIKVSDLIIDPENINKHSEESISALMRGLKQFGQNGRTIVVNDKNVVQMGNGIAIAAMRLALPYLICYVTDLEGTKLKAANISDNQVAKLSGFDEELLSKTIREIQIESERLAKELPDAKSTDSLLASMGFSDGEMNRLLAMNNVAPGGGNKKTDPKPEAAEVKYSVVVPCSSKESQDSVYAAIVAQGFEARKVST